MASKLNNDTPPHTLTKEDQIAGGKASAEARKEKAMMKAKLELALKLKNNKGLEYADVVTMGLIKGAAQGKAENYKMICQMLGELDGEEQIGTPQVNINIVDNSDLEKVLYEDEE